MDIYGTRAENTKKVLFERKTDKTKEIATGRWFGYRILISTKFCELLQEL